MYSFNSYIKNKLKDIIACFLMARPKHRVHSWVVLIPNLGRNEAVRQCRHATWRSFLLLRVTQLELRGKIEVLSL